VYTLFDPEAPEKQHMVNCKEIGYWKNECPHLKGSALEPNKITPGKKTDGNLNQRPRTSLT
jgi:hypothetical protein